eukprot:5250083-Lingulodinium_polyedra.AAC.1
MRVSPSMLWRLPGVTAPWLWMALRVGPGLAFNSMDIGTTRLTSILIGGSCWSGSLPCKNLSRPASLQRPT